MRRYLPAELHELARLEILDEEICRKEAWKIASRSARIPLRSMVAHRYREIALCLYSLSTCQATRAKEALAKLNSTGTEADAAQYIASLRASGTWPTSTADRLLLRRRRDGEKVLFGAMARAIRRYLFERERGAVWVRNMKLLHLLSLEWLRDEKALWQFLGMCFRQWDELKNNPQSTIRRRINIHAVAQDRTREWMERNREKLLSCENKDEREKLLYECERHAHDTTAIRSHLTKEKLFGAIQAAEVLTPEESQVLRAKEKLISKDISRDLSSARAKSFGRR